MTTRPHGETRCENGYKNFTEKLVDEGVPEHKDSPASSSRESGSEPRGKVVSSKHSIYTSPRT